MESINSMLGDMILGNIRDLLTAKPDFFLFNLVFVLLFSKDEHIPISRSRSCRCPMMKNW